MTRPPTRGGADSVRLAGGSRPASMTVLDVDSEDPTVKRDAWFVYLMPVQTGVQMMASGHFGYWEERPKASYEPGSGVIRVEGGSDEPILLVTANNKVSLFIATAEHTEARPVPQLKEPEQEGGQAA